MTSKLASLHAGLVARKGEAMPAVSHPAFSYVDTPRPMPRPMDRGDAGAERRVLTSVPVRSWDAGAEPIDRDSTSHAGEGARRALGTVGSAALHAPAREVEDSKHPGRYRLTFRMTPDQRRRLRIAAAKEDQSLQQLLSDALDGHLDGLCACSLRDCTCLARHEESEI